MKKIDYIMTCMMLVIFASLIGLAGASPAYRCGLLDQWLPFDWSERLWESMGCLDPASGVLQVWWPFFMLILALVLPVWPALHRLHALGHRRAWALFGLLPAINLVLFVTLGLRSAPVDTQQKSGVLAGLAALAAVAAAGFLYYHLLLYRPWLAGKS